eukprot:CAMPEP_0172815656 /NCGR_PEP_ID=MMETSP1075-20121228/11875_1 /TAXON_ID=2916 /ORGANISM="Ceratium fusus, Strain PA161109" /LENGTH=112 /DNA_ID=CAMNT_0013655509 /DNA_START=42 /DNA_END=381 /DNA_ORIENTATION=-
MEGDQGDLAAFFPDSSLPLVVKELNKDLSRCSSDEHGENVLKAKESAVQSPNTHSQPAFPQSCSQLWKVQPIPCLGLIHWNVMHFEQILDALLRPGQKCSTRTLLWKPRPQI